MKSHIYTSILLLSLFSASAQEKKRDTLVTTEVVNIITRYNPKIAAAKKIAKNPTNTLLEKNNKKKLKYLIYSAPVASTFIPKSGVVKGINVGVKERVYRHYLAAGFGNYKSPYAELFISKSKRFDNAFGLHATYTASNENIDKTKLTSTFSNFSTSAFYTQEEHSFDWKIQSGIQRNAYNWYGLPQDRTFTETVINAIDAQQNYTHVELAGDFNFYDAYLKKVNVSMGYFLDRFKSSEILVNFNIDSRFPISFFKNTLNDISITGGLEFLKGSFKNNYQHSNAIQYQQNTLNIIPQYSMDYRGLSLKASLRTFVSLDTENKLTNFFVFPEVQLQTDIYKKYIHGTIGFTGNLHTNTYQQFTEENPYVSPTLFITQTAETANLFIAFDGSLSRELSYHLKLSAKKEEDKPLFLRNKSKSAVLENPFNENTIKGYEYGNSFTIYYDDVQTSSIFAEVDYR
ncbi:TonB-dependent receptor [Polaribacter sp.]|nr:TonB-dependent receptor [Polaribacter sp.]